MIRSKCLYVVLVGGLALSLPSVGVSQNPSSSVFTIGTPRINPSGPIGKDGDPYSLSVPVTVRSDHRLYVKAELTAKPSKDQLESPVTQFSGQISGGYTFVWNLRSYELGGNLRFSIYISRDGRNWSKQGGN